MQAHCNFFDSFFKGCSIPVKFVDIYNFRDMILSCLITYFLRLSFYTSDSVENTDCSIQYAERSNNLKGEVCMTGCVNKIYIMWNERAYRL